MKCGDTDSLLSLFESIRRIKAEARLTQDKVDVRSESGEEKKKEEVWPRRRDHRHPRRLLSGSGAIKSAGICGDETV